MSLIKKLFTSGALALGLACTPSSGFGGEENKPNCEEQQFSERDFDRAFDGARKRMEAEGYEVRSSLWEDEERFTLLMNYMVGELGCSVDGRRYGGGCEDVRDLLSYRSEVHYCGPGAGRGNDCLPHSGECMNNICYQHDVCYNTKLENSKEGRICVWSDGTEACDQEFFNGYSNCREINSCETACRIYNAMAKGVKEFHDTVPICLWPEKISEDKRKKEEKNNSCEDSHLSTDYLWAVQGCRSGTTETLDQKCYTELQVEGSSPLPLQSLGNTFWTQQGRLAELIRDFSTSNFSSCNNTGRWPQLYRCAVDNDPDLYLATINGDFCSNGGLWRIASSPWPGMAQCAQEERSRSWYSQCDAGKLVGY